MSQRLNNEKQPAVPPLRQVTTMSCDLKPFSAVRWTRWGYGLIIMTALGCSQEMANQPRVDVMEPIKFDSQAAQARVPVTGTIARGQRWEKTPLTTGRDGETVVATVPVEVNEALLLQGQKQYNIFCQHCHGPAGNGDGMVVQRGFPAPPSYHIDRLRDAPDGQIFIAINEGMGRMPALGRRITPEDRWAIVAYVRALQMSQNSNAGELSESDRQQLQ